MIRVHAQTKDHCPDLIVISGHAGAAADAPDLICAEVSAVSIGTLNALDIQCPGSCDLQMDTGYVSIKVRKPNDTVNVILNTLMIQLQMIADAHSEYVQIEKVEV
ncbi:ribosomal-processing cysteine protease Prp [Catenisphaera adipataccumulans]|uniref:Ribosomal processing cysteine protease Prp n=1 Tax=Catenisphaera adipataccumulans TaxID=700500 RepID=A0A7W8CYV3_9FIRM|nr:ribosomal-processing cysteine protease Prp [Catenisphaera adipataccumulans]MBB5183901.1 hypothetical protein [Catenisphaera adipataccumulans]